LTEHNVTVAEPEEILGYTCEVFETTGKKYWYYKGVKMKVISIHKETNEIMKRFEVVEFKPDVMINPAKFQFPNGINEDIFEAVKLINK